MKIDGLKCPEHCQPGDCSNFYHNLLKRAWWETIIGNFVLKGSEHVITGDSGSSSPIKTLHSFWPSHSSPSWGICRTDLKMKKPAELRLMELWREVRSSSHEEQNLGRYGRRGKEPVERLMHGWRSVESKWQVRLAANNKEVRKMWVWLWNCTGDESVLSLVRDGEIRLMRFQWLLWIVNMRFGAWICSVALINLFRFEEILHRMNHRKSFCQMQLMNQESDRKFPCHCWVCFLSCLIVTQAIRQLDTA